MAAADDPKTQIQASPTSSANSITSAATVAPAAALVKAPKARMAPEAFNKIIERFELILVALVLVFAFLTASFAIRNSDFFQYLAVGRLLAHGEYEFGKDPFSFATENVRWVNHSWLYSYFLYLIYSLGETGGAVLIVLKALAITLLMGVLLVLSRKPGQRWLIPVSCTAVAILALSARLLLQPILVSYLFLGLTLLVLRWPSLRPATKTGAASSNRCFWLLAPLFALWVNCDQWFFLGPVTAGLYWLGQYGQDALATDRTPTRPPGELRTLGYAVLASCAACLLNPHHVFALTLPPQLGLSSAATAVSKDNQLQYLFLSPLDKLYWAPHQGLNAAGIAYFPLLAAGVLSFGLSYKTLRYWRVLLFVAFGLLSVYHARAIPFFAIVAGPIVSLNFLDFVAGYHGGEVEPDRLRHYWLTGRIVALVAAIALVVCSVPGWTHAQPFAHHHVAWKVVPDESLVRTCGQMAQWRREGLLEPRARWFNVSPDVVNYMAWYCPGERGFLDLRLGLYDGVAGDYVAVRADMLGLNTPRPGAQDQSPPAPEEWPKIFEKYDVNYLIIYYPDKQAIGQVLLRMGFAPTWTLMYLDGHTLVFAWNKKDVETRARNERLKFDMNPLAFGVHAEQAPHRRPERLPVKHEWYTTLWETPPARQEEVDDAAIYNLYYQMNWEQNQYFQGRLRNVLLLSSVVGGTSGRVALSDEHSPVLHRYPFTMLQHPLSPAPLYVAVRGLRRSLKANPDDVQAYLSLAQTYLNLFWETQELEVTQRGNFQQLSQIRQTQITSALNKAIELDPDSEEAHFMLVEWYRRCRRENVPCYFIGDIRSPVDTELRHYQEVVRIRKEKLDAAKETEDVSGATEARIRQVEQDVQRLETDVKRQLDQYAIKSENKSAVQKAQIALELGLGDKALEVLRNTPDEDMVVGQGQQQAPLGFLLKVNLLLALGEIDEARTYIHDKNKELFSLHPPLFSLQQPPEFRVPAYDWFRLLIAAASGDYDDADDALAALSQFASQDNALRDFYLQQALLGRRADRKVFTLTSPETVALLIGSLRLNRQAIGGMPWLVCRPFPYLPPVAQTLLAQGVVPLLGLETDYPTLRGWMALEAGDITGARQHFRSGLIPALPHDRNLALFAAVGPAFPAAKAHVRDGPLWPQNDLLPLRSAMLAKLGLYFIENADAKER